MFQALNILFWWAAAGVALYYFRKTALAIDNAALAVIDAVRVLDDDGGHEGMTGGPAAHSEYGWGGVGPITTTPIRPTSWAAEQEALLREERLVQASRPGASEPARCADKPGIDWTIGMPKSRLADQVEEELG